jgi:aryl-alcohol dehydrogenase-like predicted oxidoreductase
MNGSILVIGRDRPVSRLGFGAMRLCGPDCWCPPDDRAGAIAVARRAFGALTELQDEDKIRHIGLPQVSTAQLAEARTTGSPGYPGRARTACVGPPPPCHTSGSGRGGHNFRPQSGWQSQSTKD